ncbi:hypothetical protein ACFOWM_03740 [Ferruginibacter yonginensis]|uniref:Surface antigen-like protein n=1 Tax=Ferruginibacter yonginensis TaxID=1310416 RepID=A0ABV8QQT3_9BACT
MQLKINGSLFLKIVFSFLSFTSTYFSFAQQRPTKSIAEPSSFQKPFLYKVIFGKNNRSIWSTQLDTISNINTSLAPIYKGSFIENIANDEASTTLPFHYNIIAPLLAAANIKNVNSKNYNCINTATLLQNLLTSNQYSVDDELYLKNRLFDMWVGVYDHNETQWQWGIEQTNTGTKYFPIAVNYNTAFTTSNGKLTNLFNSVAQLNTIHSFKNKIKDIAIFNEASIHIDQLLLNQLSLTQWQQLAAQLQNSLTDSVINNAVNNLPANFNAATKNNIAFTLKNRRTQLQKWATEYYYFLAKEVVIPTTAANEILQITPVNNNALSITISNAVLNKLVYKRVFKNNETKQIRLYSINGEDVYQLPNQTNGLKIIIISGAAKNIYVKDTNQITPNSKVIIYDYQQTLTFQNIKQSSDSNINRYHYDDFKFSKKGVSPIFYYDNADRFYLGIIYKLTQQRWPKKPFAYQHYIDFRYSIMQNAYSGTYKSTYKAITGKWDLNNYINYDAVRWTNFYGLGNASTLNTKNRDFYRMRSKEFIVKMNLEKTIANQQKWSIGGSYKTYRLLNDSSRYIAKQNIYNTPSLKSHESFVGADATYIYQKINDSLIPTKGFALKIKSNITTNTTSAATVFKIGTEANYFLPLSKKWSIVLRAGGSTLAGKPQFFQYDYVGGTETLRGYQRERFYGNSTIFNQNEIRYFTNVQSYLYNGPIGFFGLYDVGKVWLKGETNRIWHTGYGLGFTLAPFKKLIVSTSYAFSKEDSNLHIEFSKAF